MTNSASSDWFSLSFVPLITLPILLLGLTASNQLRAHQPCMSLAPLLGDNLRLRQLALIRVGRVFVFLLCVHETMTMIPASPLALVSCCSEDKTSNVSWWQQPLQTVLSAHAASSSTRCLCLLRLSLTGRCSVPFMTVSLQCLNQAHNGFL